MNDTPQDLVLVAQRLSRALVADGDVIERDARARLAAAPPPVLLGETLEVGPSIDLDIGANNGTPMRRSRHRLVLTIAAVVIVSLAVVVTVSRRDSGTVVTGGDEVRYFLPAALPDGIALENAILGYPPSEFRPPPGTQWRRIYTERDGGVLGRILMIDSVAPFSEVDPPTTGQPVVVGGKSAFYSSTEQGILVWFKDDFGCGYVSVAAIGYDAGSAPPAGLVDQLASIKCAPTSAGGTAAAITVPRGFKLEVDDNVINENPPAWRLSYFDQSKTLSPLSLFFGRSRPSPDLTASYFGRASKVSRNGRDYWTVAPLPVTSPRGAYVAWNEGPYLLTISSVEMGLDELLAVADSVREVDKATFDNATRAVMTDPPVTTTR